MVHKISASMGAIIKVGLPVAAQSTLLASMGLIDTFMVSPLGENAISAIGVGARWVMFITILLFCFCSAGQIMLGQLFGAKKEEAFNSLTAICFVHVGIISLVIGCYFFFLPLHAASVITDVQAVSSAAQGYIRVMGIVIFFTGLNIWLDALFRSVGETEFPFKTYVVEILINIILNYGLIFGAFGLPEMGITGAAVASLLARLTRTSLLFFKVGKVVSFNLITKSLCDSLRFGDITRRFYSFAWPILISGFTWSSTMFTGHAVIGHLGKTELTVMSLLAPIELIALSFVAGVTCGTSIKISHSIGNDNHLETSNLVKASQLLAVMVGFATGLVFSIAGYVLVVLFGALSEDALSLFLSAMPVLAFSILLKTVTGTQMQGILKSGGDSRYCMYVDGVTQWMIVVPTLLISGFLFSAPFLFIYLIIQLEEIIKMIPCSFRIQSNKWRNKIIET